MMPMMSSMTELLTNVEHSSSTAITAMAPAKAANNVAMKPLMVRLPADNAPPTWSITRATPRLAPLLMPKMEGPASGLRNAVCNSSPLAANAPPQRQAVMACGNRVCRMMYRQLSRSTSSPRRMWMISPMGIGTAPKMMLRAKSTTMVSVMTMQKVGYLMLLSFHFREIHRLPKVGDLGMCDDDEVAQQQVGMKRGIFVERATVGVATIHLARAERLELGITFVF